MQTQNTRLRLKNLSVITGGLYVVAYFLFIFVWQMSKAKKKKNEVNEPAVEYGRNLVFFNSFEEMDEYDRKQMAMLTPVECLEQLRKLINLAYGMHGYDSKKLPKKHSIKIIPYKLK